MPDPDLNHDEDAAPPPAADPAPVEAAPEVEAEFVPDLTKNHPISGSGGGVYQMINGVRVLMEPSTSGGAN